MARIRSVRRRSTFKRHKNPRDARAAFPPWFRPA